ncbi:hypothetical protein GCM10020254_01330 [Streptomyces goshikiensis]
MVEDQAAGGVGVAGAVEDDERAVPFQGGGVASGVNGVNAVNGRRRIPRGGAAGVGAAWAGVGPCGAVPLPALSRKLGLRPRPRGWARRLRRAGR